MTIEPNSFEFNFLFVMTLIILAVKLILSIFLAKKIYDRWKETGEISFGFITSVFILMVCLFISRLFYMQYDFVYTKFDPNLFYTYPAILFYKIATLVSMFGYAVFLFTIDRKILNFKFKGIFSYIIFGLGLIVFFYPVNSLQDLEFIAMLLFFANVVAIIIPILFFYIGRNREYRKPAYMTAIGIIIFAIAANIGNITLVFPIITSLEGLLILMHFISHTLKVFGLVIFSYGINKFVSKFK